MILQSKGRKTQEEMQREMKKQLMKSYSFADIGAALIQAR